MDNIQYKGCPGNNAQFQNLITGAKKNFPIGNLFRIILYMIKSIQLAIIQAFTAP